MNEHRPFQPGRGPIPYTQLDRTILTGPKDNYNFYFVFYQKNIGYWQDKWNYIAIITYKNHKELREIGYNDIVLRIRVFAAVPVLPEGQFPNPEYDYDIWDTTITDINIEKNELHEYKFHEIEFLNGINPFLSQEGGKRKTKKSRKIRKSKRRSAFKKSLLHPTEKSKKTHRK
jgi:hypothetical protein